MNIKNKKIIIFGCQQIAIDCIKDMSKMNCNIAAIVTYELPADKKYGYASVYDIAKKLNIPIYQPEKIDNDFINKIKKINPDLLLSIYYRKIFPKKLIDIPPLGCVNIHPSLLPYYRGPIPTFWAMLNGEKKCGVTVHFIDESTDTGPIIAQKKITIKDTYTGFILNSVAMKVGHKLLMQQMAKILNNTVKAKPQKKNVGSYYGKFQNRLRFIDWHKNSKDINNQIRVMTKPFMGCLSTIIDKDIIIWKAKLVKNNQNPVISAPGKILKVYKDKSFLVSTPDSSIKITNYDFLLKTKNKQEYIKKNNRLC